MQSRNCKSLSVVCFLEKGSQPTADRGPPYTLACLPNTLAKEHYDKQSRIFTLPTNEKFPDPKPRYKQTRLPSVVALSLSLSLHIPTYLHKLTGQPLLSAEESGLTSHLHASTACISPSNGVCSRQPVYLLARHESLFAHLGEGHLVSMFATITVAQSDERGIDMLNSLNDLN